MQQNNREELQFFGRICASVSHDIKNVLAVVNEGAGLLSDLSLMAEKGTPLDPARLRSVSESIQAQIRRGDGIIKDMNTFAHSVDEPVGNVSLADVISLVVSLATRLARAKSVSLELGECGEAVVRTDIYGLEYLLHAMITHALSRTEGGTLAFSCRMEDGSAVAVLSGAGLDTAAEIPADVARVAEKLGMTLVSSPDAQTLELVITV